MGVTPATSHAPPGPAPASQRHRSSEIGYFRETTSPPLRHPKDPSRGMPAGARGDSVTASTSKPAHHRPSLCRPDQGARILVKAARGGRLVQCENAGTRNGHFTAVRTAPNGRFGQTHGTRPGCGFWRRGSVYDRVCVAWQRAWDQLARARFPEFLTSAPATTYFGVPRGPKLACGGGLITRPKSALPTEPLRSCGPTGCLGERCNAEGGRVSEKSAVILAPPQSLYDAPLKCTPL